MKEVWVHADPWKKELVTTALEAGADAVIVPNDRVTAVKKLGMIKTVSESGDLKWGKDVIEVVITGAGEEEKIIKQSRDKKVVVKTTDWSIIPLENLIARTDNIYIEVHNSEEAKTALGILEKGVAGVIVREHDPGRLKEIINGVKSCGEVLKLAELRIGSVRPVSMGDRVCVDTCTMMKEGEGILTGNSSQGLFLIHSESVENPYVSPRPFRINAGAVHAYVRVPGGKTRYLCELMAGDEVVGVDSKGRTMNLTVGRVKIERRPMLLVQAIGPNGLVSAIVQNAETIRLVGVDGKPVSVVNLKPGDKILGLVEEAGRHFGYKIKESITER